MVFIEYVRVFSAAKLHLRVKNSECVKIWSERTKKCEGRKTESIKIFSKAHQGNLRIKISWSQTNWFRNVVSRLPTDAVFSPEHGYVQR